MPILACLTSFLLACACISSADFLARESSAALVHQGAGLQPVPTTGGPVARTPERAKCLSVASFNVRRPAACK
jgi:hypothetical protein